MSVYGRLVSGSGPSDAHRLIVEAVPGGSHVLDVGCADGYLAALLAQHGCVVDGVERDPAAADAARAHCARVWTLDLDDADAREPVTGEFGAVVMGDVLEHLRDPWSVLRWGVGRLAPGGVAVVSVPNAVVWHARRQIAFGRFPLEDWGTFDRTHLRWFTLETVREMVRDAGLTTVSEAYTPAGLPLQGRLPASVTTSERFLAMRRLLTDRCPQLFALQFVVVGRKA